MRDPEGDAAADHSGDDAQADERASQAAQDAAAEAERWVSIEMELVADEAELQARRENFGEALHVVVHVASMLDALPARHVVHRLAHVFDELIGEGDPYTPMLIEAVSRFVIAAQFEAGGAQRLSQMGALLPPP